MDDISDFIEYNPNTGTVIWCKSPARCVKVGASVGSISGSNVKDRPYLQTRFRGKNLIVSRLIFTLMGEPLSTHEIVDHINHNTLDNRWVNLRKVSHTENKQNQKLRMSNTSGTSGVHYCKQKGRWIARIGSGKDGVKTCLGSYLTKEEAVKIRKKAEKMYNYHPNHGKKY